MGGSRRGPTGDQCPFVIVDFFPQASTKKEERVEKGVACIIGFVQFYSLICV